MRTVSNRGSHIKWQPILQGVAVGLRVPKRDLEQRPNIGGKAQIFIMRVLQQDWNFCLLYLLSTTMFVYHKKNSPLLWLIFCECDIFSIANFSHFLKAMIHGQIIKHKKKQHKPDSLQNQQNSQIQITNFISWERKLHLVVSSNFSMEKT